MLHRLEEATGIPIKANIRLGTRVNGKLQNEAYFVLNEAPEVKEIYGEQPEFLEIMFPGDSLEAIAPAALECWSGTRDKDGKIIGGDLVCSGPGPREDGSTGVAVWRDRIRMPPEADCIGGRDQKTGYVQRHCRGEQCTDWLDAKGYPKCKQTMRLYFIIPRVSPTNVYRITTHAWHSMFEYYRLLNWVKETEGLAFKPFKIYKEAKSVKHWDASKGKEFSRAMPILRIEKDDLFLQVYGKLLSEKLKALRDSRFFLAAPPEPGPMLLDSEGPLDVEEVPLTPSQRADLILADAEVQEAFSKLETVMGKSFDVKARQMYVLKKEGEDDVRLAVIDGLTKSTLEVVNRTVHVEAQAEVQTASEVLEEPQVTAAELLDKVDPLPQG